MKKKLVLVLVSAMMSLGIASSASAKDEFALGIQSGLASYGVSGTYFMSNKVRAQVIVLNYNLAGRGQYFFSKKDQVRFYGVGEIALGFGSYSGVNMGVGAGAEVNWQALIEDIFPLYWNLELGIGSSTGKFGYLESPIRVGMGMHYRF